LEDGNALFAQARRRNEKAVTLAGGKINENVLFFVLCGSCQKWPSAA
jgi:hypothetical protein